jgi:endo-1,4-beta-xylanase
MLLKTGSIAAGLVALYFAGCSAATSDVVDQGEDNGPVESGGQTGVGGRTTPEAGAGGSTGSGGKQPGSGGSTGSGGKQPGSGGSTGSGGTQPGSGGSTGSGGTQPGSGGSTGSGGTTAADGGGGLTKFAGNISTRNQIRSDFKTYWDQFSPENEGKWGSVQPSQGVWNWAALDAEYKYANDNNIIFKEHCFVWGSQQPSWVNNSNAQTAVRTWMQTFCNRYPNVKLIDVVNEPPPHTTPAYKDGIGGDGASGYDWIVNAFKWAREFCPNAILILNDYNTIEYGGDNAHIIDIVNRIKRAGAPIDAVGAQAHAAFSVSTTTVKANVDRIVAQTGLPVYITEYDIDLADDTQQKNVMAEQFPMFWTHGNIKGVTLWGYIVGSTWLTNTGLMTDTGVERPAMTWLRGYLER